MPFFNGLCSVSSFSYFTVEITARPSYNDIDLCDTSSITSDILWDQLNDDTKYSVPLITLLSSSTVILLDAELLNFEN